MSWQNKNKSKKNLAIHFPCPILTADEKYIVFVGSYEEAGEAGAGAVSMYDVDNDCYPVAGKREPPINTNLAFPSMAYEPKSNCIYICGGYYHPSLLIYDLNTKEWIYKLDQKSSKIKANKRKFNMKPVGGESRMVIDHNHTMHVIGGHVSNCHFAFNSDLQMFEQLFQFPFSNAILKFGLVCDSMNDRLIMFGGKSSGKSLSEIWFYNLSSNFWSMCKDIALKIPLCEFGFIFLEYIQIILIFGGMTTDDKLTNLIFVLDLNDKTCTQLADIQCPRKGMTCHALLVPHSSSQSQSQSQSQAQQNNNNSDDTDPAAVVHLFEYSYTSTKKHFSIDLFSILPQKYHQQMHTNLNESPITYQHMANINTRDNGQGKNNNSNQNNIDNYNNQWQWRCPRCTFMNERDVHNRNNRCAVCSFSNFDAQSQKEEEEEENKNNYNNNSNSNRSHNHNHINNHNNNSNQNSNQNDIELEFQSNSNPSQALPSPLSVRELAFKSYFYASLCNNRSGACADKYYASFVSNELNDLETMLEFERADEHVLVRDVGMHAMHAKSMLTKILKLKKSNSKFVRYFEADPIIEDYYESVMVANAILSFPMLYQRCQSEPDLIRLVLRTRNGNGNGNGNGMNDERLQMDAQYLWSTLPMNVRHSKKVRNENDNHVNANNNGNNNNSSSANNEAEF